MQVKNPYLRSILGDVSHHTEVQQRHAACRHAMRHGAWHDIKKNKFSSHTATKKRFYRFLCVVMLAFIERRETTVSKTQNAKKCNKNIENISKTSNFKKHIFFSIHPKHNPFFFVPYAHLAQKKARGEDEFFHLWKVYKATISTKKP